MPNNILTGHYIRKAEFPDLAAIVDIESQSSKNPWSRKTIEIELNNSSAINKVACLESGKIISFIFSWHFQNELEIQNLATHPDFRKCGFAKNLLEITLKQAYQNGALKAFLEVRAGNLNAIELYRKFGFEVNSIRKKYYSNQENALIMALELSDELL